MNLTLFLTLFGLLTTICLWMGRNAGKKNTSTEDYFLAGRSLKLFPLTMTLLATQLGGGALMGAAEEAYTKGWSVLFYPLGMVLGLVLLGLGVGGKMRRMELKTVAELFERHYNSPLLRRIASLLSILSLFFILTAQAIAARKFFGSLGFMPLLLFSIFWLSVVIYTTFGGLRGVVVTDIVQALFILAALSLVVLFYFLIPTPLTPLIEPPLSESPSIPWFSWLIAPLLFMLIEQDMGQRCFSAKDSRTISRASFFSAALLLIATLVPIGFGSYAGKLGLTFDKGTSVLLGSVSTLTHPIATTLIALAILMAIISTVDSLLNSISSNLVFDFPFFKTKNIGFAQGFTALLGLTTFLLSFLFDNVLAMLIFSYELSISVLAVPLALALLGKSSNKRACMASMLTGAIGFFALKGIPFFEIILLFFSTISFFVFDKIPIKIPNKQKN